MNVRHGRGSPTLGALARAPRLTGLLLAASLVLTPVSSHGQRAPGAAPTAGATATASDEGAGTALRYVGCAVSIAFASTTLQIWLAALACTTLLVESLE